MIYPKECGISLLSNGQKILTILKDDGQFVHLSLHNVCKQIWQNVPGSDWFDAATSCTYKHCFVGSEATQFLLDAQFAPDAEEAVDYLAHIQDEINAFHRVDTGKNQEFENNEDAHYQWI